MEHKLEDIIAIFNQCFEEEYNTRLVKGGDEPIYIPANDEVPYNAILLCERLLQQCIT